MIDLDQLEKGLRQIPLEVGEAWTNDFLAVIKRLREAEADLQRSGFQLVFIHGELKKAEKAKDIIATMHVERIKECERLEDRIGRLKSVVRAGTEVIDWSNALYAKTKAREYWTAIRLVDAERLRTALAALE